MIVEAESPGAPGPRRAARASVKSPVENALQVEPRQELLDRLGPPEVGRQDRRGETDLAGLSRTPAVAHPGAAHRDQPDAGLNLALSMMAVANDTAPARIVLQIAVCRDEGRDLHLNGLRQETLRSRVQDRRQGILRK